MTEPVIIAIGFRNDGKTDPIPACITSIQGHRKGFYQHLTEIELEMFEDNLTMLWEAEFYGEGYELIAPITQEEVDDMPYRCTKTEDMFA